MKRKRKKITTSREDYIHEEQKRRHEWVQNEWREKEGNNIFTEFMNDEFGPGVFLLVPWFLVLCGFCYWMIYFFLFEVAGIEIDKTLNVVLSVVISVVCMFVLFRLDYDKE